MFLKKRFLCRVLVAFAIWLPTSLLAQTIRDGTNAKPAVVRVPFVGCPSNGQGGSKPAPKQAGKEVVLDAGAARRLAYYEAYSESEGSRGLLAPRGWHGFGRYGSAGTSLTVLPYSVTFDNLDTLNSPFIMVTQLSGETSGRFQVARVIARVFPTQKAFADGVIKEGIEPASDFPFGPYPTDTLKYHGDVTVEFQTPANTKGLGTEFGLQPNDQPISGVAAIKWDGEDIYLVCLTVRLMPDTRDLTTQIMQQFERDQELP